MRDAGQRDEVSAGGRARERKRGEAGGRELGASSTRGTKTPANKQRIEVVWRLFVCE